ncbi:MAG: Do family serine endopeptidase [bacterium]|nr:Do family serine endopeptidase [bacterium]
MCTLLPTLTLPTNALAIDIGGTVAETPVRREAPVPSLALLIRRVSPSVVSISAPPRNKETEEKDALGSGVIISPAGYVVTNNHVIIGTKEITVVLQDGSQYMAKLVGHDDKTDLALLKIDAGEPLPFVNWGNSDKAEVGDWVVAIGNPFGFGGTVTVGIVSALGRNIGQGPYDHFIQIDAAINRGNSGGPTFNLAGEVIGINALIYSGSGGFTGVAFAIPSNIASGVIAELKDKGYVKHGWLGVKIQRITPILAKLLGMNPVRPNGTLVTLVFPESPAAKAGVRQGDVIVSVDGHPVKTARDLPWRFGTAPIGQRFVLHIFRNGNETVYLTVTVEEEPQDVEPQVTPTANLEEESGVGLRLSPTSPELRFQFKVPKDVNGVVVTDVADGSPASIAGIKPGDVLLAINRQPVETPREAVRQLKQAASAGDILLLVSREGQVSFVGLSANPNAGGAGN